MYRILSSISLLVIIMFLQACISEDILPYAPTETYPEDEVLASMSDTDRKAMVVIAHDDDMCAMSGTMAYLNEKGWEIAVLSMSKGELRNEAQRRACASIADTVIFANISLNELRMDDGKARPHYHAFPKDSFDIIFNKELVRREYLEHITKFDPNVMFTLDTAMGGYGHPEHVLISQMVLDLSRSGDIKSDYIYQSVFTDHMENSIMERHSKQMKEWGFPGNAWEKAKDIYDAQDGMSQPTVQINIEDYAQTKMQYLKSYNERERKIIGYFIPAYEEYDAEEYFKIFDREFFHVIEI